MSPADLDLARKLAAHRRWEWRAGVRTADGYRVRTDGGVVSGRPTGWRGSWVKPAPDLDDPATAGVLLGKLAETCRVHPTVTPTVDGRIAVAFSRLGGDPEVGPTLGVAAARALLAAWGPA